MASSNLLALPRELRNIILEKYVATSDGYAYNFSTNKIQHRNGDRIDLSLALTCRQLAHEMRGLAVRTNTIHFSTFFSEETREHAGLFHAAIRGRLRVQSVMASYLAPKLITPAIVQSTTERYPALASFVETWTQPDHRTWKPLIEQQHGYGMAPSLVAESLTFVLELLSARADFSSEALNTPGYGSILKKDKVMEILHAPLEPWDIPAITELEKEAGIFQKNAKSACRGDHIKYAYSAAALAIQFLKSISGHTRAQIRRITLHEDYESIARPECHARGLISFCKENPKLHIHRVVKLWQNALSVDRARQYDYITGYHQDMHGAPIEEVLTDKLTSRNITKALGAWIVEAHALPSMGMPNDSFTLIFDGKSTPEKSTGVFGIVQRDVAWQQALDISYERGYLPTPSWADRRIRTGYLYESLPTAMDDISQGKGLIRCNFDPGMAHNAETLAYAHRDWTLENWCDAWDSHEPPSFQTDPPLPPWHELKWQRVLPKY